MAKAKPTPADEADPPEQEWTDSDKATLDAGLTAAQLARINGTVLDGASGNHVLGIDTPEHVGEALAEQSRSAAQERADSQSDED